MAPSCDKKSKSLIHWVKMDERKYIDPDLIKETKKLVERFAKR